MAHASTVNSVVTQFGKLPIGDKDFALELMQKSRSRENRSCSSVTSLVSGACTSVNPVHHLGDSAEEVRKKREA